MEKLAKRLKIRFVEINASKEDSIKSSIEKASKFYDGFDGAVYNSAITSEGLMDTKKYSFEKYLPSYGIKQLMLISLERLYFQNISINI